jgi:hypothetical protein
MMAFERQSMKRIDEGYRTIADAVGRSFIVEDVTDNPERLRWAFDLIVQGYLPLSSKPLTPWEVSDDVCNDQYHRYGIARTLVLTGCHPETGDREPMGTVRVTMGSMHTYELGFPPLEAMNLMLPSEGWDQFRFEGFDVDQIVEGGRVAVSATCRIGISRDVGLPAIVLRALFEKGLRFAVENHRKSQYWGILPSYVIKRVESLGIRIIQAPKMSYKTNENAEMFEKYDRYWLQSNPVFCRVIVPEIS